MRKKIIALKSSYLDSFDWSVYDSLQARYLGRAPYWGVVYKTTFRLVNHYANCSKCHYAFELDTYGRGCVHDCIYCYARDQLTMHGCWNTPQPFPVDLAEIRKIFHAVFETNKRSKWRTILEKRIPLRLGSMSDCFMWIDKRYKVTYELLKILKFYRYPYIVFTRSDLVADEEYIAVMDPQLASIQMSISGDNEKLTRLIEPAAPSVHKRFLALRKLAEHGLWTTVRVNPLFPSHPDGYFTDEKGILERFGSKTNVPTFPILGERFFDLLSESKVPSVLAGFVRLSPRAVINMSEATGVNFQSFYKPELYEIRGDKRYSDNEIAIYYKKFQGLCAARGIRFSTCYIGNGTKDYFNYQSLWDNKADCCDARGNVAAFTSSSQDIPWPERRRHSKFPKTVEEQEPVNSGICFDSSASARSIESQDTCKI